MDKEIIKGVYFYPIEPIITIGGSVMHAVKHLDANLPSFGECYFSTCDNKSPKAWKKHTRMICNLFVPTGAVKFVFYDDRVESSDYLKIKEITMSRQNYGRLTIRPGIWFGFSAMNEAGESIIVNLANIQHDPEEYYRLEPSTPEIPFIWKFD